MFYNMLQSLAELRKSIYIYRKLIIKIMARKHSEDEVLRTLARKHDVKIRGMEVFVLNQNLRDAKHDLGNLDSF